MSYILDALKKAEKERKQGKLPDMLTVQDIVAEKPKKSRSILYLLAAALVLNAGILVWWLGNSQTVKKEISQTAKAENSSTVLTNEAEQAVPDVPAVPAPVQASGPEMKPAEINVIPAPGRPASSNPDAKSDRPKEMPKMPDAKNKSVTAYPAAGNEIPKPAELPAEKTKQASDTVRIPPGPVADITEMPDENKIYKLMELPAAIRKGLPSFSVTALLYSDSPASRMVRVNEQMMREGQELAAGVKLEEITRDGLVFSYHKYRFFVATK